MNVLRTVVSVAVAIFVCVAANAVENSEGFNKQKGKEPVSAPVGGSASTPQPPVAATQTQVVEIPTPAVTFEKPASFEKSVVTEEAKGSSHFSLESKSKWGAGMEFGGNTFAVSSAPISSVSLTPDGPAIGAFVSRQIPALQNVEGLLGYSRQRFTVGMGGGNLGSLEATTIIVAMRYNFEPLEKMRSTRFFLEGGLYKTDLKASLMGGALRFGPVGMSGAHLGGGAEVPISHSVSIGFVFGYNPGSTGDNGIRTVGNALAANMNVSDGRTKSLFLRYSFK